MHRVTLAVWLLSSLLVLTGGASTIEAQTCADPTVVGSSDCTGILTATLTGSEDYDDSVVNVYDAGLALVAGGFSGALAAGVPFSISAMLPYGDYTIEVAALCPNGAVSGYPLTPYTHACDPDCNGNGTPDVEEFSATLITKFFTQGLAAWTATGLWHVSSEALCFPAPPICDDFPVAYFGQDTTCNFDTGAAVTGDLTSPAVTIPAGILSARLRYCSIYVGEAGSYPPASGDYDVAWVEVNGTVVETVSDSTVLGAWEDRFVDLTPFEGQSVTIAFRFDSFDAIGNLGLGWAVDAVILEIVEGDCNNNGTLDECDLTSGFSQDCNANGIPDECDIASGLELDCNSNGVPDACDISSGASGDCDGNGVPDECDISSGAPDCNFNDVPDICDVFFGTSDDCNSDGIPDECGFTFSYGQVLSPPLDFAPGVPAIGTITVPDSGAISDLDVTVNIPAAWTGEIIVDVTSPSATNVILHNLTGGSGDDIITTYDDEGAPGTTVPFAALSAVDGEDRAGTWTLTVAEQSPDDPGTLDSWALHFNEPLPFSDCDMSGTDDLCDIANGLAPDCNGNGVPDDCDLASGFSTDCDANGVLDDCENSTVDFTEGFDAGVLPVDWGSTGLWNVTDTCATGIGCGTGPGAYFGDPVTCNFDFGGPVSAFLFAQFVVPAAVSAELSYCSAYVGEGGSAQLNLGTDFAWVEVNGVLVDDVSRDGSTPGGETRTVNLTPYIGQFITVAFGFNSVDEFDNATLGWRIDDVQLSYGGDCDSNGISDACEILAGADDCDTDGVPDACGDAFLGYSNFPGLPIVSFAGPVIDTMTVAESGLISDVDVFVDISHTWIGDLQVSVTSPASTSVFLHNLTEGNVDNLMRAYDDDGAPGTFIPAEPLSGFDGEQVQGDWSLTVIDDVGGDDGTFNGWVINFRLSADCNGNGVRDACDLAAGTSGDCNQNGIPDECEIAAGLLDCDTNGVPDICESFVSILSEGFDGGAVPGAWTADGLWNVTTACDTTPTCDGGPFAYFGDPMTCNFDFGTVTGSLTSPTLTIPANTTLRYCSRYGGEGGSFDFALVLVDGVAVDVASSAFSEDTGWVTREVDLSAFAGVTTNVTFFFDSTDQISNNFLGWQVDGIELLAPPDCNGNGVSNVCDIAAGTSADCNSNGVPDECDVASGSSADCNSNGVPDECDISSSTSSDCNSNGIPDECDTAMLDCNSNGIPDDCDIAGGIAQDCNGNSIPDTCDIASGVSIDCNFNSIPDDCEIAAGIAQDCNGNGIPDTCDIGSGFSQDCNINSIPDDCDIASGIVEDCNVNGIPDLCDIGSGTSTDGNLNGVPDECEAVLFDRGDCNADGSMNIADGIFTLATLFSGGPAGPCADACDANDDGNLNIADAVFTLATLFSGGPNPSAPFGVCGTDPTADNLDCMSFSPCP